MRTGLEQQFENLRQQNASGGAAETTAISAESVLSFVVPTEMVDLPSQGKFYPEGHPLKDKSSIEIKQMTAKEEDILTNKSFIKKGIVIDKLIESLIVDKTIDVASLLIGDKNAILVAARAAAYGEAYDLLITCTECGAKKSHQINLSNLDVTNFDKALELVKQDEEIKIENTGLGSVLLKLPKTGWYAEMRPLNGLDERRMMSIVDSRKGKNMNEELTVSEQLNFIIKSINTVSDRKMILDAISIMPATDAKFLRNIYQKIVPNIRIMTNFGCGSCGAQQEMEVPFTQEFFWPK